MNNSNLEFGVDWYPEQWDEARWRSDARRIAGYGFTSVRIMEFAWTIVEPEPGRFDFSLFDRAVAVLADAGLKVILGTPTATPPHWLIDRPVFRVLATSATTPLNISKQRQGLSARWQVTMAVTNAFPAFR